MTPYLAEVERLLADEPTLSGVRIREQLEQLGYAGGKTILDNGRARVPPQPYLRFDRNDYSLDPRRVELRATQSEITALALDTDELCARHVRVFAGGLTFTDPDHQRAFDELRGERKRARREPEVELRPLARYDALIPA